MICAGRCRRYTQRWQAKSNQSLGIFSMNFARSRCDRAADLGLIMIQMMLIMVMIQMMMIMMMDDIDTLPGASLHPGR